MSVSPAVRTLRLYDVLANLIPGAILLLTIGVLFQIEDVLSTISGIIGVGVFIVISIVFGHGIQAVASFLDGTPTLFGDTVRASKGQDVENSAIKSTHIERRLWPLLKQEFSLPDDFDNYGELFRLLLSYVETTPARRSLRFQALHSFHRNMWGVCLLVFFLSIASAIVEFSTDTPIRSWEILILTAVISMIGIYIFNRRKKKFNRLFVQYTIADFYVETGNDTEDLE